MPQLCGQFRSQRAGTHTPGPVALRIPGRVHAGIFGELQQVLHGHHEQLRRSGHACADQCVAPVLVRAHVHVLAGKRQILLRHGLKPAIHRLVVMGPDVADAVLFNIVGHVVRIPVRVEGELQDLHTGEF